MEKIKLISMTDFVSNYTETGCLLKEINKIRNYANFLKQPLTLGMFIPCDESGNVLEYPIKDGVIESHELLKEYEQAKEKVLFEGWEKRIKDLEAFKLHLTITKIIENTIEWDLILTQNATKQFL